MDHAEGISAAFGNDCARGGGASRRGFSISIQYFGAVRRAVADVYERGNGKREIVWGWGVLGSEDAVVLRRASGIQRLRHASGESVESVSEVDRASDPRCVLRRDGADSG